MELLKLNDKGEEITRMSNEEIENISGGLKVVGDSVYELDSDEIKTLTDYGYTLEKIGDGKFKIKDNRGVYVGPAFVQAVCKLGKILKRWLFRKITNKNAVVTGSDEM